MSSSATIDAWVQCQEQEHGRLRPLTKDQLAAFLRLFNISSDDDISSIADCIAKPLVVPGEDSPNEETLWWAVSDAVNKLTSQNDNLVRLVIELQRLPYGKDDPSSSRPWWSGLPYFDNYWTEWITLSWMDEPRGHPDRQANRQAHINQHAFLAKLTAQAGDVEVLSGQVDRGGCQLRQALEMTRWDPESVTFEKEKDENYYEGWSTVEDSDDEDEEEDDENEEEEEDDKNDGPDGDKEDKWAVKSEPEFINAEVPAAAQWLKYAPEAVYNKAAAGGELFGEYEHNPSNFGLQKGWSKERWDYWQQRFVDISSMAELEEETRRIAKEAAERMIAVSAAKA